MMFDFTKIIGALVVLINAIIVYVLVPWIKAKASNEEMKKIRAYIKVAAYAAEQIFGANSGEEKLQYVFDELAKKGIEVERSEIEAIVYEEFNAAKRAIMED